MHRPCYAGPGAFEMQSLGGDVSVDVAALLLRHNVPLNQHAGLVAAIADAAARDVRSAPSKRGDTNLELEVVASPFHEDGREAPGKNLGDVAEAGPADITSVLLGFGIPASAHDELLASLSDLAVVSADAFATRSGVGALSLLRWCTPYVSLQPGRRAAQNLTALLAVLAVATALVLTLTLHRSLEAAGGDGSAGSGGGGSDGPDDEGSFTPTPTALLAFDAFPPTGTPHPLTPQANRWGVVKAPFPTGAWWTNAMIGKQCARQVCVFALLFASCVWAHIWYRCGSMCPMLTSSPLTSSPLTGSQTTGCRRSW